MRVLVTGASGTIGRALCDALFARGDDVVGLTRDPGRARQANPRVTWHRWEPTLERPRPGRLRGRRGVVHLLGERIDQRWTDEAKQRIIESRRTGTHNLVRAIVVSSPPKVMVSQSAVGYYGDRGAKEVDEGDGPGSSFDAEVVLAWEAAAHELDGSGVRLVITRTGQVLDRGRDAEGAADALQARRRRPAGGRRPVLLLDPHRRRGRDPALGAGQRACQRLDQRQLTQPRHQQRVLQGAGPSPQPPRGHAGPRPGPRPQIRQRVRQGPARRRASDPEAHRRSSATSSGIPISTRRCGTCSAAASSPGRARRRGPRSRSSRCRPGARRGSRAGAP